jgi:16S rRNA (cytosine1402-N4)-methyltransferase
MPQEVLACLDPKPGQTAVDCTLGGAGHARLLLTKIRPGGTLIAIDQDADAISNAQHVLPGDASDVHLVHDNFDRLPQILIDLKISSVDLILADLGLSLHQIVNSGRGFSFQRDEPLDMRMDTRATVTAAELVNRLEEKSLADLFHRNGEERWARRIAKAVVRNRQTTPIATSRQLAEIVRRAVPAKNRQRVRIHPATRVFMALRIEVNRELDRLDGFLSAAVDHLHPGGRLCVLAFHSLEDRIVKQYFRQITQGCQCPPRLPVCSCNHKPRARLLCRRALKPQAAEIDANPMARSTRLRAIEIL